MPTPAAHRFIPAQGTLSFPRRSRGELGCICISWCTSPQLGSGSPGTFPILCSDSQTPSKQTAVDQTGLGPTAITLQWFKAQHYWEEAPKANPPSPTQHTWAHLTKNLPTGKMTLETLSKGLCVEPMQCNSHATRIYPDSPCISACGRHGMCVQDY